LPDLNVWLALSYQHHTHYRAAHDWYAALPAGCRLAFCRVTQMGLLRLLTNAALMRQDAATPMQAWRVYEDWLAEDAVFLPEYDALDGRFREISRRSVSEPADWADAYLAAFAETAGLQLVTFDRQLHKLASRSLLLKH
jgi:toxin-antitoxin system PIN domain toxin